RDLVTLLLEPGLGRRDRVLAVEEGEELPLLRSSVVEDENAAHAFGRRHLARGHPLLQDPVGRLGIRSFERGDPYPHAATSLLDAPRATLPPRPSRPSPHQPLSRGASTLPIRRTCRCPSSPRGAPWRRSPSSSCLPSERSVCAWSRPTGTS